MNIFLKELKTFFRLNFWVFLIFFISLFIIFITNNWSLLEILIVFSFHFLWDLFVMMFSDFYKDKNYKKWSLFQILSTSVFLLIWIYGVFKSNEWQYFIINILFITAWIKSYFLYTKSINLSFINHKSQLILFFIILLFCFYFRLFSSIYWLLQFIWMSIFSIALVETRDNYRYFWSLFWLSFLLIGSVLWIYSNFLSWEILWTTLSYFFLPLSVFIFYIKNLRSYIKC